MAVVEGENESNDRELVKIQFFRLVLNLMSYVLPYHFLEVG